MWKTKRIREKETTHLINLRSIANKTVEEVVAIIKKKKEYWGGSGKMANAIPFAFIQLYFSPQIVSVPFHLWI